MMLPEEVFHSLAIRTGSKLIMVVIDGLGGLCCLFNRLLWIRLFG